MKYYISQYGYVWSFSKEEFKKFLQEGMTNDSYVLPANKELKDYYESLSKHGEGFKVPSKFQKAYEQGRFIFPLDWEPREFKIVLEEIEKEELLKDIETLTVLQKKALEFLANQPNGRSPCPKANFLNKTADGLMHRKMVVGWSEYRLTIRGWEAIEILFPHLKDVAKAGIEYVLAHENDIE